MRVGFVGTGEITAAMVRALAGQGHRILVSPRNLLTATALASEFPEVSVVPNAEVVAQSDVVFLCLLAPVAFEILPDLPFRAGQQVISVMVDAPLSKLRLICAPATDIAITIPLPPIAKGGFGGGGGARFPHPGLPPPRGPVLPPPPPPPPIARGGCPLPVYPASPTLESLFGAMNLVLPQPSETALNAHLGASALCSPILDQLLTAADWLAGHTGDPAAAEAYIAAMIRGYLPERAAAGDLAGALRKLSTEGGLNATLRAAMAPAKDSLRLGLDGFHPRLGLADKEDGRI